MSTVHLRAKWHKNSCTSMRILIINEVFGPFGPKTINANLMIYIIDFCYQKITKQTAHLCFNNITYTL